MGKGVLFCSVFGCLVVLFSSLCYYILFWKNQKGYVPAIIESFFSFVSPKGLSLKSFFSSYSVFFSGFPFVFPFKTLFVFFPFCPSTPFWKTLIFCFFFISLVLAFSFLNAYLFFQTNFPNIPILKPELLSFLVVHLCLLLFLFLFSCFIFLPFCFDVGFVFGMLFVLVLFLFCFLFCFHRLWKHRFPCNSSVFVMLVTRWFCIFQFHVLVLVCFFLCCLFPL